MALKLSRRKFLIAGAVTGGGLLIGYRLLSEPDRIGSGAEMPTDTGEVALNAWLKISNDGVVTVAVPRSEMGQGVYTALPMLVAEELEADWNRVRVEQAPVAKIYGNITILTAGLLFPPEDQGIAPSIARWTARKLGSVLGIQVTGGSTSVRDAWEPMRQAGATARELLVQAASKQWNVDVAECEARSGKVVHRSTGRSLGYGELAEAAARLDPPCAPKLKDPASFKLIGKPRPRLDTPAKVDGSAEFGIDVRPPKLSYAAVKICPVFGGSVKSFDAAAVTDMTGVIKVAEIPNGVAVVADSYWRAKKALDALPVSFDAGPNAGLSSEDIYQQFENELEHGEARNYRDEGDTEAALAKAARVITTDYRVPFLAHACMEPMNATALVQEDRCELWASNQAPTLVRWIAAKIADLDDEAVTVHTPLLGGGFGRRAELDTTVQAVTLAKQMLGRPVQLIWSREEDMQHDVYRPAAICRFRAGLDENGDPVAWAHRIVGPSVSQSFAERLLPWAAMDLPDKTNAEGAADRPYEFPNQRVEHILSKTPVPVGFWRSVGHSYNAFFCECFMDELAHAAGRDPYEFRRVLLKEHPRHRRVLDTVVEKAGWKADELLRAGIGRGLALHASFGSIVAQVAEVSVRDGRLKVHRVVCVIDCGQVINPDTVLAQMESGIVFGLTAALYGEITIENGRVKQSNFPDYPMLRMTDAPRIETHIVHGDAPLGGVGETAVPPIAPAVVNAVFAATGRRIRSLPVLKHNLS